MYYFKIGENDYSMFTNELKVSTNNNYNSQTNAAGNTVVDLINKKRTIEVGIIPLNDDIMKQLKADIAAFNVNVSYLDPDTGELGEANCIIPSHEVSYYTIQADKVLFEACSLTFEEL
jgi:hypothetical protein